jgi:hypothetical protein
VDSYRVYFLGSNSRFVGVNEIKAKDDSEALMLAHRLYLIHQESVRWSFGFELWNHGRLVHKDA